MTLCDLARPARLRNRCALQLPNRAVEAHHPCARQLVKTVDVLRDEREAVATLQRASVVRRVGRHAEIDDRRQLPPQTSSGFRLNAAGVARSSAR
jgi:hypothetical protein